MKKNSLSRLRGIRWQVGIVIYTAQPSICLVQHTCRDSPCRHLGEEAGGEMHQWPGEEPGDPAGERVTRGEGVGNWSCGRPMYIHLTTAQARSYLILHILHYHYHLLLYYLLSIISCIVVLTLSLWLRLYIFKLIIYISIITAGFQKYHFKYLALSTPLHFI